MRDQSETRDGLEVETARGEQTADAVIEAMYRAHRGLVYRIALRYSGGSAAWAEDRTQEVFVELVRSIHSLDLSRGIEGWLYRVTTRRCLSRLRRDRFLQSAPVQWILQNSLPEDPALDDAYEVRDELTRLLAGVAELAPKERIAFCMHHLDEVPQKEICEVLGHSKGYVSKLIARAEHKLRARVDGSSDDERRVAS